MTVPSRSKKTAGLFASPIFETFSQFRRRNRCRPELAHNNRAGVIGNFGCFERSGAAAERQRKQSDRGVARARNIEYLTGLCRNLMRFLIALEKHHPFFS